MKKECCPTCGQSIMMHRHTFSKALAEILIKAAALDGGTRHPFHLQRDLNLTKNQYANFQKLQYWGLVKKYHAEIRPGESVRVGGHWVLTKTGLEFVRGDTDIPRWVKTLNNTVRETSGEWIKIDDALGYYLKPAAWAKVAEPVYDGNQKVLFGGENRRLEA